MDNLTNICEATSQSQELDNIRPTHRKGKKLLAEKKRRARINNCLMQIRRLVCEEQDEQDTDIDKMEKAEILEKTLEVLTRLRHESPKMASTHKAMAIRYASGFSLCAEESIRYIHNSHLVPSEVKVQLQTHLRAIARRVESTVQVESQHFNLTPDFSSPPSSDKLVAGEMLSSAVDNSSVIERVSGQFSGDVSEASDRYITPPVCCSTPLRYHHHLPFITPSHQLQELDHRLLNSSEAYRYNSVNRREKLAQGRAAEAPYKVTKIQPTKQTLSSRSDSVFEKSEGYSSDSSQTKHSFPSHSSPFCLSKSSLYSDISSTNSPIAVPNCSSLRYRTVHAYPMTSNTLGAAMQVNSNHVRELKTTSKVLDLCVKQTEVQQISPETMWRPW